MANDSTERLNMEGQENNHGEAKKTTMVRPTKNPHSPPPTTTDPQVVATLSQAYSLFTTMLKCLLENPLPIGEPVPPTRPANPPT
ncbi:hypothetical protein JCGZ_03660 [Jatropha curcas]|uniref:Uncharacterized protein n=1 Tax=Jatropha curcas TaxID=180498 RepID=A0A067JG36_JATCU|nr:hypothetical protein JCGZ_03660 [Jatropha curcas]